MASGNMSKYSFAEQRRAEGKPETLVSDVTLPFWFIAYPERAGLSSISALKLERKKFLFASSGVLSEKL